MTFLPGNISRRFLLQSLMALPIISTLLRSTQPEANAHDVVEINGWILKKGDLA